MTDQSVNESFELVNPKKIQELLSKSQALLNIALNSELQYVPVDVLHNYFEVLSELISSARRLV